MRLRRRRRDASVRASERISGPPAAPIPSSAQPSAKSRRTSTRQRGPGPALAASPSYSVPLPLPPPPPSPARRKRVVVVGAGLSGLAAALELQHRGFHVVVLEGRPRVGGRVWTASLPAAHGDTAGDDSRVDLGASFVHGIEENPVAQLATASGCELFEQRDSVLFDRDGRVLSKADDKHAEKLFNEALEVASRRRAHPRASTYMTPRTAAASAAAAASASAKQQQQQQQPQPQQQQQQPARRSRRLTGGPAPSLVLIRQDVEQELRQEQQQRLNAAPLPVNETDADDTSSDGLPRRAQSGTARAVEASSPAESLSLQQALDDALREVLPTLAPAQSRALHWNMSYLEYSLGSDLSRVSNEIWDADDEFAFGGAHCMVQGGLGALAQRLSARVGDLRLGRPVRGVDYRGDGVVVELEGGARIAADACVCTLPLGVLKRSIARDMNHQSGDQHGASGDEDEDADEDAEDSAGDFAGCSAGDKQQQPLWKPDARTSCPTAAPSDAAASCPPSDPSAVRFTPPLPAEKVRAARRLRFGLLNKVALRFRARFWTASALVGFASASRGEWPMFWDATDACNGAPTLLALVSGAAARRLERMTDAEAVADVLRVLDLLYDPADGPQEDRGHEQQAQGQARSRARGHVAGAGADADADARRPVAWRVTRWRADAFARGSYSFAAPGAREADYDALAAPVSALPLDAAGSAPRLLFAGEHTNKFYPATVHGALMSGVREARRAEALLRAADESSSGSGGSGAHAETAQAPDAQRWVRATTRALGGRAEITSESRRMVMALPLQGPVEGLSGAEIRRHIIHSPSFPLSAE